MASKSNITTYLSAKSTQTKLEITMRKGCGYKHAEKGESWFGG